MGTARRVSLRNERGAVLVYVALALVFALLGMVALAIDMGYMYVAKAQLQNAADAGALAGASKLTGQFSNISAHYKAQQFAQKNHAAGETVKVDANLGNAPGGDTVVGCWDGAFHETPVANCTRANAI